LQARALLFWICFAGVRTFASVSPDLYENKQSSELSIAVISGNDQYSRAGIPFREPVIFRVTDRSGDPVAQVPVILQVMDAPETGLFFPLPDTTLMTDSLGTARLLIGKVNAPGDISIMVSCHEAHQGTFLIKFHVRRSNWVFLLVIGVMGGLGLFLFGMSLTSEGVQNFAGNRLRNILATLTQNRFVALGSGALVTMIIHSSNATNVMLISFVNSGLIRFRQTIGIMLGAAIGTTITAQIIAFRLTDYSLLLVAIGLAVGYLTKRQPLKELGKALLGFGLLFFGMQIMSESMYPLRTYDPFLTIVLNLQNPVIGVLAGTLMTSLVQSSSAFIGILIIFSMQGLLTLDAAIPLLIGANVGTSVTVILASLKGSRDAKQVALAHTLFKITGAVAALFLLKPFTQAVLSLSSNPGLTSIAGNGYLAQPRQIANAHTIYNIALCTLFLPFTKLFVRFIQLILPSKESHDEPFRLRFINDNFLKAPIVALDSARYELIRMMKKVYFMTEKIIHPFLERKPELLDEITRAEEEINFLRDQIVEYLLKISQNTMAADVTEEAFIMMNAVREFEQIADVISHQLKDKALSWCNSSYKFSEEGKNELIKYHEHTLTILIQALKVYESFDLKAAKKLKTLYRNYRQEYFDIEQQHYDRLKENNEITLQSSKTHLEIITLLRVISSHATNTSRILLYKSDRKNIKKWPQ
jgi:phosphate:Na+ symporter